MEYRLTNTSMVLGLGFEFTTRSPRIKSLFDGRFGFKVTQTLVVDRNLLKSAWD